MVLRVVGAGVLNQMAAIAYTASARLLVHFQAVRKLLFYLYNIYIYCDAIAMINTKLNINYFARCAALFSFSYAMKQKRFLRECERM